jgi:hypothetical protein
VVSDGGESTDQTPIDSDPLVQVEKRSNAVSLTCHGKVSSFQFERWSSLNKAYRIIAWVLRFIKVSRGQSVARGKELSQEDIHEAKELFVKLLQQQHFGSELSALAEGKGVSKSSKLARLAPFLDDKGLLRVSGKIQLSELAYESKHPLILPRCHGTLLLVRFVHLSQNHAGVEAMITKLKADFEVFVLRQMAKSVKKSCMSCQRWDSRACNETIAPLPKARVTKAPVFTVTGLDFAGPVYCIDFPGQKFYICLFVCGVVRAIHLELVDSLTSEDFILAFRRFSALKRVPSIVYSDNGRNIVGGQRALGRYLGPAAPTWRFICPRSPWWGGWWERLVRSDKSGIRKTIGRECLTKVQLQTCLCEVATSINSRPLTFVGTDVGNKPPLTPNHFLAG